MIPLFVDIKFTWMCITQYSKYFSCAIICYKSNRPYPVLVYFLSPTHLSTYNCMVTLLQVHSVNMTFMVTFPCVLHHHPMVMSLFLAIFCLTFIWSPNYISFHFHGYLTIALWLPHHVSLSSPFNELDEFTEFN